MRRLVLVTAVVISFIVVASPTKAETKGCAPSIGKRVPIVLVHGLNSNKDAWGEKNDTNSMLNALSRNSDFFVETFDYSVANKEWVDDPRIGPALAGRVACLAESSRQAGGIGKVITIGHSMGGLAIRYASRTVSQDMGLVVTIGTPNTGSGWANAGAIVRLACLARKLPSCSLLGGSALAALQNNIGKTSSLPTLSGQVFAIAGDETLHGYLFKKKLTQTTNSDIIVSKKSALLPDSAEKFTMPCDGPMIDPFATTCWHSALTNNPTVEKRVLDAIRKYLANDQVLQRFVGEWWVHGDHLTIRSDGTGKGSYRGPVMCVKTEENEQGDCANKTEIIFHVEGQAVVGTHIAVFYSDYWSGEPTQCMECEKSLKGKSFRLEVVSSHLLFKTDLFEKPFSEWGNPYLCQITFPDVGRNCGA